MNNKIETYAHKTIKAMIHFHGYSAFQMNPADVASQYNDREEITLDEYYAVLRRYKELTGYGS